MGEDGSPYSLYFRNVYPALQGFEMGPPGFEPGTNGL
jgi:hypothetical protein